VTYLLALFASRVLLQQLDRAQACMHGLVRTHRAQVAALEAQLRGLRRARTVAFARSVGGGMLEGERRRGGRWGRVALTLKYSGARVGLPGLRRWVFTFVVLCRRAWLVAQRLNVQLFTWRELLRKCADGTECISRFINAIVVLGGVFVRAAPHQAPRQRPLNGMPYRRAARYLTLSSSGQRCPPRSAELYSFAGALRHSLCYREGQAFMGGWQDDMAAYPLKPSQVLDH